MEPFYDVPYYQPMDMSSPFLYQMPLTPKNKIAYTLKNMNLSSTIKTCQKTIYTINQIIPIIHQVRPLYHNAKTAFKVINVLKSIDDFNIDEEIDQCVDPSLYQKKENDLKNVEQIEEIDVNTSNLFKNML